MKRSESLDLDDHILKALNHDIRRKILLELFDLGWAGYSELTRVLKLTTGVFYHHIRLLEEAGLVKQSEEKTYEITPKGIQTIDFLQKSFPSIKESQFEHWLSYYNIFSDILDSFPLLTIFVQFLFICSGLIWLGFSHQSSLVGYFIISLDQPLIPIIYSFIFTFTNIVMLYGYLIIMTKRFVNKIPLAANTLFPQTIAILIVVIFSVLPILMTFEAQSPLIGLFFTLFFHSFSLTYYLHVLQKNGVRSVEKIIVGVLLLQYWNLVILYLFF